MLLAVSPSLLRIRIVKKAFNKVKPSGSSKSFASKHAVRRKPLVHAIALAISLSVGTAHAADKIVFPNDPELAGPAPDVQPGPDFVATSSNDVDDGERPHLHRTPWSTHTSPSGRPGSARRTHLPSTKHSGAGVAQHGGPRSVLKRKDQSTASISKLLEKTSSSQPTK